MYSDAQRMTETLKVLANENRLLILCELMDGSRTVGALEEKLGILSQSALSQHLALLKAHGMVNCVKSGKSVTYSIEDKRVEEIIATLRRNYCASDGNPRKPDGVYAGNRNADSNGATPKQ